MRRPRPDSQRKRRVDDFGIGRWARLRGRGFDSIDPNLRHAFQDGRGRALDRGWGGDAGEDATDRPRPGQRRLLDLHRLPHRKRLLGPYLQLRQPRAGVFAQRAGEAPRLPDLLGRRQDNQEGQVLLRRERLIVDVLRRGGLRRGGGDSQLRLDPGGDKRLPAGALRPEHLRQEHGHIARRPLRSPI